MAEMAADGGHCTLSPRMAQAAILVLLQAFSGSRRRGMIFALVVSRKECWLVNAASPYGA